MNNEELYNEGQIERYLAGEMTPDEEVGFERSAANDPTIAKEISHGGSVLSALFDQFSKHQPAPRKQIKDIILGKIAGVVADRDQYEAMEYVLRSEDSEWLQTIVPGIELKMIYVDDDGRAMVKARFAAGAVFPPHLRTGTEECLVLSGDFWADNQQLHAGDFIAGRPGFEPFPLYSETGCELLLKIPIPYEIMPKVSA